MTSDFVTQDRVRYLLDYDPVLGTLIWRNPTSERVVEGGQAGTVASNGRRYVNLDNKRYLAHRLVWFYVHGVWPVANLSAKNNDYDDLRLANYHELSPSDTVRQGGVRSPGTSGIRGVCWDKQKKKWLAHITVDYRSVNLGRFNSKEEAAEARQAAEKRYGLLSSVSAVERARLAERTLRNARLRVSWRRLLAQSGGIVGWGSYEEFANEVMDAPKGRVRMVLAPLDENISVGPGNWKWVESSLWNHKTKQGRKDYQTQHRARHKNSYRDKALRRSFGIGWAEYSAMLDTQDHKCAICRKEETAVRNGKPLILAVDHCHTFGDIRGLLCRACNNGVGHFLDNANWLRAAADYLDRHRARVHSVPASHPVPLEKER